MELGSRRAIVLVLIFILAVFSKMLVWVMVVWARAGITSALLRNIVFGEGGEAGLSERQARRQAQI
jgi:hypothetical protein